MVERESPKLRVVGSIPSGPELFANCLCKAIRKYLLFFVCQMAEIQIHDSWKKVLADEFAQSYFSAIKQQLLLEKQSGKIIYPSGKDIFAAFDMCPFDSVKVVILGQDPYHGV